MNLVWTRGDTAPFTITLKYKKGDKLLPVDLSSLASITLCINSEPTPTDDLAELFKAEGVIDADPTTGRMEFSFTDDQADNLGEFYYDIQGIDGNSKKKTYKKGFTFTFEQDINKD